MRRQDGWRSRHGYVPRTQCKRCDGLGQLLRVGTRCVITADDGTVQLASTRLDVGHSVQTSHRQVLEVLTDAVGLEPADRSRVLDTVPSGADQSFKLGWGSFTGARRPPAIGPLSLPGGSSTQR